MTDSTHADITTFDENEYGSPSSHHAYVEAVRRSGGLPSCWANPEPGCVLNVVNGIIFSPVEVTSIRRLTGRSTSNLLPE